jgi:hypothetical protein
MAPPNVKLPSFYNGSAIFQEVVINPNSVIYEMGNFLEGETKPVGPDTFNVEFYKDEFNVIDTDSFLIKVERKNYLGDTNYCCDNNISHYWIDRNGNKSLYRDKDTYLYLISCDPITKTKNSSTCNRFFFEECKNGTNKQCENWFQNLHVNYTGDQEFINEVNIFMQTKCSDSFKQYCKDWLIGIRRHDYDVPNTIADSVIQSQKDKSHFKCLFPPVEYEKDIPFECWYEPCAKEPIERLLLKNILNRKKCFNYNCSVKIKDLNVPANTKIDLKCTDLRLMNKEEILNNKKKEELNTIFPVLNYYHFAILFFLSLIYLVYCVLN